MIPTSSRHRSTAESLLDTALQRTLCKIDAATADQQDLQTNLRQQVDNTPGRLPKLLVARALLKLYRKPRYERLAGLFHAFGADIIGGPEGDDCKEMWTADLKAAVATGKSPSAVLADAFSNFLGSPEIRWVDKLRPALRLRFARQFRIVDELLAAAAQTHTSAFLLISVPAGLVMAFIGYTAGHLIGSDALGWGLAIAALFGIPSRVNRWHRERKLATDTQRAARASDG